MQPALRPMTLGEILDRTFEIYRKRFLLFAGIAALPAAVMLAVHLADITWVLHTDRWIILPPDAGPAAQDPGPTLARAWLVAYGYYHISGFVWLLFQPAFMFAASRELFAESNSIRNSLRLFAARWRSYLWAAFLLVLSTLIIPEALAFVVCFAIGAIADKFGLLGDSPSPWTIVMVVLPIPISFLLMLWIKVCLSLSIPAAALEQTSGRKSLARGWRLTKNSRWRIFVAWIMAVVCTLVLEGTTALLSWWIATLISADHLGCFNQQFYQAAVHFFYALITIVVGSLYPIALTLLYYDQRSRKEGYDVERMMEAAGLLTPVTAEAALLTESSALDTTAAEELPATKA